MARPVYRESLHRPEATRRRSRRRARMGLLPRRAELDEAAARSVRERPRQPRTPDRRGELGESREGAAGTGHLEAREPRGLVRVRARVGVDYAPLESDADVGRTRGDRRTR